jgi:multidrug efflux pump subunit AcrA (membrane-fusion protein)
MPFAGRVESIGLIEGQTVITGQIVARISASDIDAEVAEANTTKGSGVFVIKDAWPF